VQLDGIQNLHQTPRTGASQVDLQEPEVHNVDGDGCSIHDLA